jgi:hypothetical protein
MKKIITIYAAILITSSVFAQAPEKMSYQAIVRDGSNALVNNKSIGMRISILQGSATGTAVYVETQTPTSNANGLVSIEIGGGSIVTGSFSTMNWANGPYFIKTETDPNGGTNYTITGTSQLLSVPYALHAKTAESVSGGINETDPIFNTSVAKSINANDTARWNSKLDNYNETDPIFNSSLAKNITANDTARWNNSVITETDPLFNASVAKSISSVDTANWNNKLNIESDPVFTASVAYHITADDTIKQTISLVNDTLSLARGSQVNLSSYKQQLSVSTIGDTLFLSNSNWVIMPGISIANGPSYPAGTVHCSGTPTAVVDVVNPTTGKIWMDRNLGASRVATSGNDAQAYGDLYQWGRRSDGHQCRNSTTTSILSSTDQPSHGSFISVTSGNFDWRNPQNINLWQGVNGVNNPCPSGYRLPTEIELNAERISWSNNNSTGAFASPIKLPLAGYRSGSGGSLLTVGTGGVYWSSTVGSTDSRFLNFISTDAFMSSSARASGGSVRCIKN